MHTFRTGSSTIYDPNDVIWRLIKTTRITTIVRYLGHILRLGFHFITKSKVMC
jgi:hypothetical protein